MKVKVISLPYIFQVLYVLCFTRSRYQVSVYRTNGPLVFISLDMFSACHTGKLYERHEKQCCGGEMVSDSLVCCGGQTDGHTYTQKPHMSCCGQKYVRDDQSLCCISDTGHIMVSSSF